jgi:cysteine desulfurase/selenocysteine lyase
MDVDAIRKDFPVLRTGEGETPLVYFDSACQTLRPRQVMDAVSEYYRDSPACAGRSVHRLSTEVTLRCDDVRGKAARFLGAADPSEVAFVKNATEALNTVILGCGLRKGQSIVTTDREHNSVNIPAIHATRTLGARRVAVPSTQEEVFDMERFKEAMSGDVGLVAMCLTSSVTGDTIPARDIVEIAHSHGAKVLLDAAQTAPSMPIDVRALDVDYLAISVHKMLGPSGVGLLYVRSDLSDGLAPLMYGGHAVQEASDADFVLLPSPERFEAGLQNYSGIFGTGAAIDYLVSVGLDEVMAHERTMNRRLTSAVSGIPGVSVVGPADPDSRAGIFSFNVAGLSPHDIAMILDSSKNIAIRSGMHCCHSFFNARSVQGCARVSMYIYNTVEEVDYFAQSLSDLVGKVGRRS